MKFEGIDIYGFKSFADKVSISFDKGMTGIVGPNGCGKSNVVDAIRWVLGEQSAKILRGKTMQDVIFNGTERRKSISFCEVALKFNNKEPDRIFKTLNFDQVIISRKLSKSGVSEYLINGTVAKLKDIKALIRETGLGREGYSIVGQGRVDEIINSKPENRRAIFEDAAGVLGTKLARKEAQKNLAEYELRKEQYESLLQETDRTVKRLEKEAEVAKKAVEIQNRLMSLEANSYIFQKENNVYQKEKLTASIKDLEDKIKAVQENLDEYTRELDELSQERLDIDEKLSEFYTEKQELLVKEEQIKGTGNTLLATHQGYLRTKEDYNNRLIELEESLDNINSQLRELYAKKDMAQEDFDDSTKSYNEKSKEHAALVAEILEHEQKIEAKNSEVNSLLSSIGSIKENIGKITAEKDSLLERLAEVKDDINNYQEAFDQTEKNRQEQEKIVDKAKKTLDRLTLSTKNLKQDAQQTRQELEELRDKGHNLDSDIKSLTTQVKLYEEFVNDYSAFNPSVQKLLKAQDTDLSLQSRILGVVANLIEVDNKYQVAIENALGASMQHIVVENEENGKYLIQYLKDHNIGKITFLPITSYKTRELEPQFRPILRERGCLGIASQLIKFNSKFDSIMSGLLGSTIICDNIDNAISMARRFQYGVKIVTLQGEVLNTTGSMTGGATRRNVSLLSQEETLKNLKAKLEESRKEYDETVAIFREKNADYMEMCEQLEEYESNTSEANAKYTTENAVYDILATRSVEDLKKLTEAKEKKTSLETKYNLIVDALAKVSKQNKDIEFSKTDIDSQAEKTKTEFANKKLLKEQLDEKLAQLTLKIEENRIIIKNTQESIEEKEANKQNIKNAIADCKKILYNNDVILKKTESNMNKTVMSEDDKKRLKEISSIIEQFEKRRGEIEKKSRDISAKKDGDAKYMISLNDKKSKQENTLSNMDERMAALEVRLLEDYDLDYEKALLYKVEDFDYVSAQSEIKSLKASRNALGAVNFNAIDDYVIEKERYDNLNKEYEDLIKAEEDCKNIIATLSQEILEKFNVEFAKINENFKVIFKELFGGGYGKLELKEPEEGQDPLDAGVEIYAQPPGKKLALLMQLSGGEMALTAIAILFAILRLRPMPFCVLDEVDAALDEGNVGVYAKYLKKFSKETQFIIITHRKPTMRLSDALYGVSMQERGVSKVFYASVDEAIQYSKDKEIK